MAGLCRDGAEGLFEPDPASVTHRKRTVPLWFPGGFKAGNTTSPLLILANSSSTVRGASPRPERRIHWANVFHKT